EGRDVLHRRYLRLPVQLLPAPELAQPEAAALRIAHLAEERGQGLEVVDADVVRDMDGIRAQEVAQPRIQHGLALDLGEDRFAQVTRADAVVAGIMKPVAAAQ